MNIKSNTLLIYFFTAFYFSGKIYNAGTLFPLEVLCNKVYLKNKYDILYIDAISEGGWSD